MKIYKAEEFLNLPEGVIFCRGTEWMFGCLEIKGESPEPHLWSLELNTVKSDDSGDLFDTLEQMKETGTSHSMEDAMARSHVEPNEIFLVFEDADLDALIQYAEAAKYLVR